MRPNLQPKIYKSPVVAYQLYHMYATTRYNFCAFKGERAKTGWLRIRIMCQSRIVVSVYYKTSTQSVGLVQNEHHHHLIEN